MALFCQNTAQALVINNKMESGMLNLVRKVLLVCLLIPGLAVAAEYEAGKHYMVLESPVPTRDSSKVEVVELFWYGCPHCFRFEPLLDKWHSTVAEDVDFWHSPAMWNDRMKIHAKAYFTADVLGVLPTMHMAIFTAMNVDRQKLQKEGEIAELFVKNGVKKSDFDKAFNSFGVESSVRQADSRARGYKITGTPEMVVNGKYRVSASTAGSAEKMLSVVNFLIDMERKAK